MKGDDTMSKSNIELAVGVALDVIKDEPNIEFERVIKIITSVYNALEENSEENFNSEVL